MYWIRDVSGCIPSRYVQFANNPFVVQKSKIALKKPNILSQSGIDRANSTVMCSPF